MLFEREDLFTELPSHRGGVAFTNANQGLAVTGAESATFSGNKQPPQNPRYKARRLQLAHD